MQTVLYFQSSFSAVCRRTAEGFRDFAAEAGWRLKVVPYANAAEREDDSLGNILDRKSLAALLSECRPDGAVVHWSPVWPDLAQALGGIPRVVVDEDSAPPSVRLDNAEIGRAAAEELMRLSPASCAFLSLHRPSPWSGERTEAFAAAVAAHGMATHDLGSAGENINSVSKDFLKALASLPKPCGLFAVNDLVARRAIDAATAAGLSVPHDLAVVGVDNDESICEGPGVTLTSVRPDFWRLGFAAGELLQRRMEEPDGPAARVRADGVSIVRRASTRRFRLRDALVEAVQEDIRRRYAESITAARLAQERGVSLRTLERRFRLAKGRSIGREISDTRFRAARQMLAARQRRAIEAVANFCGYDSDSSLRKAFRVRLGMSPSAWRRTACAKRRPGPA